MFSQVRVVEVEKGWKEKARSQGVSCGQEVAASRRAESEPRCVGEIRRGWLTRVAYGMVVRVAERASGAPGFVVQGVLRVGLRGGSGAGVRVVLEWP
ncbi:hypothetical protein [Mycobacteroides abscessus]|uniref:hypothetical protein n=1 Tax=Mycobacteroides abscessus TaxID=36809 RepID=UPI00104E388B|nr:hypothetical protein [Mycobacteroides abscessus]